MELGTGEQEHEHCVVGAEVAGETEEEISIEEKMHLIFIIISINK